MQSLCAMGHLDFRQAGAHSYEQAMLVMRQLGLSQDELQEQFRRMVFNVVARNQDDHTKNIAYLMDKTGKWSLSPAFDITWAYNPIGDWTSRHQMSLNGKCDDFAYADFVAVAQAASIPVRVVPRIVEQVRDAVSRWGEFASKAGVSQKDTARISDTHRLGVQLIR
jgi:serine/threonine-protein kinase HipA